jgi:hypothetical protein
MATQGLRWHYDVTGAEPIIRDVLINNAGAIMYPGTCVGMLVQTTEENCGAASLIVPATLSNVMGVLQELVPVANRSYVATGVEHYAKVIINPFAVWLGRYSTEAADDTANTVASATGVVLTEANSIADHERGWAYVTDTGSSVGGFGNLFKIGATSTTTTITATTTYTSGLVGNTTSDTFIILPAIYSSDAIGGSVDLATSCMELAGYNTDQAGGAAIILENYIQSSRRSLAPLRNAEHSGKNYKSEDPDFFGDVMFSEHLLACGGVVNDRVI